MPEGDAESLEHPGNAPLTPSVFLEG